MQVNPEKATDTDKVQTEEKKIKSPGGGQNFRTHPDLSWVPPSLLERGYRVSFIGPKQPALGYPPLGLHGFL
jgi:hypothetical protein